MLRNEEAKAMNKIQETRKRAMEITNLKKESKKTENRKTIYIMKINN